jgi:hypothetical protein
MLDPASRPAADVSISFASSGIHAAAKALLTEVGYQRRGRSLNRSPRPSAARGPFWDSENGQTLHFSAHVGTITS